MATATLERKRAHEAAGSARARVTSHGVLHADGDVVRGGSLRNRFAAVSRQGHSSFAGREPLAGVAELFDEEDGLYAEVEYFEGEGDACERARDATWSVGFVVVQSHQPTQEELAKWPGAKRIITAWKILEVSVVERPASPGTRTASICCGPECAIAAGKSCCAGCEREAAVKELARYEHTRFRLLAADLKHREARWGAEDRAIRRDTEDRAILGEHELRPGEVNRETRWAALEAVERAAKILAGETPVVRWYSTKAIPLVEALGLHFKGTAEIWLAAQADAETVFRIACHETFHALAVKGDDEQAAESFGTALALLRGCELHVGPRKSFEDRREWVKADTGYVPSYLAPPSPRLQLVEGLPAGALVVDNGIVFERIETDEETGWRFVADLMPA